LIGNCARKAVSGSREWLKSRGGSKDVLVKRMVSKKAIRGGPSQKKEGHPALCRETGRKIHAKHGGDKSNDGKP